MRAECVVPEAQCAIKRSNKKPTLKSVSSSPSVAGSANSGSIPDYRLKLARPLKPEEEELINQVSDHRYIMSRLSLQVFYL
jgi:hypothetical protein